MAERDPDDPTRPDPRRHEPPPHPLDRVWAHPSELGAAFADPGTTAPRRGVRSMAVGAVCGAVATLVVVLAAGGLGDGDGAVPSAAFVPAFPELQSDHPAARLVAAVSSSVVVVRSGAGGDEQSGTGVVMGDDRILTNASLVGVDDAVTITTSDGTVVPAELLGRDPETDLALLEADGSDAPGARMGSADHLEVGTWVLAVGASGSQRRWANEGIISGVDLVLDDPEGRRLAGLLGTDIDGSPSSAGGPLLDESGDVVAILSRAVPGHALPIDAARTIADQLVASGRAPHGWLGVIVVDETERARGGARVQAVVPNGPGAVAGLADGDVIAAVGERPVPDSAALMSVVARLRPGDPVELTVWRRGSRLRVDASLGERAPDAIGLAAIPA